MWAGGTGPVCLLSGLSAVWLIALHQAGGVCPAVNTKTNYSIVQSPVPVTAVASDSAVKEATEVAAVDFRGGAGREFANLGHVFVQRVL
jgi:hypothetical protein